MAKSLEDLGKTTPSKSSGHIARLRTAAKESKQRSGIGIEELGNAYEARKDAFPLRLDKLESGTMIFLNDGVEILAHTLFMKWLSGDSYGFPSKEKVRCSAWALNKEGAWVSTGSACPFCILLDRDPRLTILWALIDLRQRLDTKTGKKYPISVRRVEMDHEQIMESIFQGVEIEASKTGRKAAVKFARFRVSRSSQEKSLGCGDSWTMIDWVDPSLCEKMMSKVPDWTKAWPIFSQATAFALAAKHVKVCDEHKSSEGYSAEGYRQIMALAGGEPAGKKPAGGKKAPKKAATKEVGQSLEDLADMPAANVTSPADPVLEDMVDLPGDALVEVEAEENASSAAEEGTEVVADADSFDPWGDNNEE